MNININIMVVSLFISFFFFNYYLKRLTWFIIDIAIQVIPFTKASYTFSSSRFADLVTYKSR